MSKAFKVTDVKTEYVLLDFTGVYCGKINKAILPHYDKIKDKLTIVYFYTDINKDWITKSVAKEGLPWTIVSDFKSNESVNKKHYEINGIPDFFLLDKERNIVKHVVGYN